MARILLVDDDQPFRDAVGQLLRHHGHEVCEAEDGEAAIRMQLAARAEVVLCDVVMPRMQGGEAMRAIRALTPEARIIAISGGAAYCQPADPTAVIGADVTLAKPCSGHDLLEAVEHGAWWAAAS